MKPTVDEYKIISQYLVDTIDWDSIYGDTLNHSKMKFGRDEIINHIKKLILNYPDHFDESIEGRIESASNLFKIRYGILNNYVYLLSDSNYRGWFIDENNMFKILKKYYNNKYYIILDYKKYLRNKKLLKLTNKIYNYE